METVTLQQVLAARDRRAQLQQQLLAHWQRPLISFTMNIAGPVKHTPLIEEGFRLGLRRLEQQLLRLRFPVLQREVFCKTTGCEAIYAVDAPAEALKSMAMDLEEADALGRLLDLDVLDPQGVTLDRPAERGCLICGAPGRGCARSRTHSVEALQAKTRETLETALRHHRQQMAGELASRALLYEACTTPKPGLVDRTDSGSHRDMDLFTFLASAAALTPYFCQCTAIGQETALLPPEETFRQLRRPGRLAEGEMYRATEGINTHKGAVFLMGVLCGALGRLAYSQWADPQAILTECAAMTRGITAAELQNSPGSTAGEQFFLSLAIGGIRREIESGLPTVRDHGLPAMQQSLDAGAAPEEAGCRALLAMMAVNEDTALLHRGGPEGWAYTKRRAAEILQANASPEALAAFNRELIQRNLSPGGSADLLAVCYLLHFLQNETP